MVIAHLHRNAEFSDKATFIFMTTIFADKKRVPVDRFKLGVLGGMFTVTEILPEDDQSTEDCLNSIHSIPADRWFVILADSEGTTQDVLALINDEYEFQFVALGTLESD